MPAPSGPAGTNIIKGGRSVGFRGAQVGQDAKYGDIAKQQCVENFKQTWNGGAASGIAGARLTATPEFKNALATACPPAVPQQATPAAPPPAAVGGNMTMPPPPGVPAMNLTGMNRG